MRDMTMLKAEYFFVIKYTLCTINGRQAKTLFLEVLESSQFFGEKSIKSLISFFRVSIRV